MIWVYHAINNNKAVKISETTWVDFVSLRSQIALADPNQQQSEFSDFHYNLFLARTLLQPQSFQFTPPVIQCSIGSINMLHISAATLYFLIFAISHTLVTTPTIFPALSVNRSIVGIRFQHLATRTNLTALISNLSLLARFSTSNIDTLDTTSIELSGLMNVKCIISFKQLYTYCTSFSSS